jgi:hypothetical protein
MRHIPIAGFRAGTITDAVAELGSAPPGRRTLVMLPLAHGKAITAVALPKRPATTLGQPAWRSRPNSWI